MKTLKKLKKKVTNEIRTLKTDELMQIRGGVDGATLKGSVL